MDTDRLNKWLTLAANIGVLVGIVFLALEVRQANRIAITSTELAVRSAYSEVNNAIYTNRDLAELLAKVTRPDFKLAGADSEMIEAFAWSTLNNWLAVETAYENGLVPRSTFNDIQDDMRSYVEGWPAMNPVWQKILATFPSFSQSHVYRMLDEMLRAVDQ